MPGLGPFRCEPSLHRKPWAGGALRSLGVECPPGVGELWLVSDLPAGPSVVLDGPFAGRTLPEVVAAEPEALLGAGAGPGGRFPLLVKLLDIGAPLSVQVHPDGAVCRALGDGDVGKCEAWLVIGAGADARVYLGLLPGTSVEEALALARAGGLEPRLASFAPEAGEAFEIVPGTLHAARGVVVLEVQEPADVTYRVYDWGRTGRALHLDRARACLEALGGAAGEREAGGWTLGLRRVARRCPFRFDALELGPGQRWELPAGGVARVVTCAEGTGALGWAGGELPLAPGGAVVIPATVTAGAIVAGDGLRVGFAAARAD